MKNQIRRTAVIALLCALTALLGSGAALAEGEVPVWVLPGLDLGPVLDPTIPLPTDLLRPIVGLLP